MKTIKEHVIQIENAENCNHYSDFDINAVIAEFKEHGFNVTEEAIMHNFEAWQGDCKSGYRDDENGYFLYTPCGCNPLRFYAKELIENDYLETYIA